MKIDFVSDVSCPWCAIGLHALDDRHLISGGQPVEVFEQALRQIAAG